MIAAANKKYDCIVCGGGMTGVAAAVSAARLGLTTALIERTGCLGGVATSCGVNHILGGKYYDERTGVYHDVVGGIYTEICATLIARNAAVDARTIDREHNPHGWMKWIAEGLPFDATEMKVLLDELCEQSGVDVFFFSDIIDVTASERAVESITVHNKSGQITLSAPRFIDATGDADIIAAAGFPVRIGRDADGLMAPASVELCVDRVDRKELGDYIAQHEEPRFRKLITTLREKGIWDFPYDIFIAVQLNDPDVFMINTIRQVGVNGLSGRSLSRAAIDGRRENRKLFSIMKEHFPGFKNARIRDMADTVGVRETRRINGEYTLTVNDLTDATRFTDTIASSSYGWDLPDPKRPSHQPLEGKPRKSDITWIPYRTLVPRDADNVIAAGRCISVERDVLGPVRVMGPCLGMGQAAGTAAYLAHSLQCAFRTVPVERLTALLREQNCIVEYVQE